MEEFNDKEDSIEMDGIMHQFKELKKIQNVKTDQMVLDSVTILLNSMITSPAAVEVFNAGEVKDLKSTLFNILNKYNEQ